MVERLQKFFQPRYHVASSIERQRTQFAAGLFLVSGVVQILWTGFLALSAPDTGTWDLRLTVSAALIALFLGLYQVARRRAYRLPIWIFKFQTVR